MSARDRRLPAVAGAIVGAVLTMLGAMAVKFGGPGPLAIGLVAAGSALVLGAVLAIGIVRTSPASTGRRPREHALIAEYTRDLVASMSAYVVVLVLSLLALRAVEPAWLRAVIALLPVVPIALAVRAMVRHVRRTDEMQRRIELEAVSVAAVCVSMLYMTGGFLQLARVIDIQAGPAMIWVFPLMSASYGLAKAVVARRYG